MAVEKSGFAISGSPKTATVYYASSFTEVHTFNGVTANGSATQTTTELTLTFSQAISGFTTGGTLNVAVEKAGFTISGSPKTATIYYATSFGFTISLADINEWELTEQTAQVTANVNKVFNVAGTYSTYRWYLDGTSVGTSSSYTFNKPAGVYQLVVVVTNSSGESRSGRCRVTVTSTTILSEDFEGTNSFTIVNGSQTNQWWVGTATANGGTKSAYISNNSGTSNTYTITTSSTVHMYRNVTFTASTMPYTLSFYWKAQGESTYDYMTVHLVETTTTPTAGSSLAASTQIGSTRYNLGGTGWNQATISIPASNSGTTKRLVFTWVNDNSQGTTPPVAIDNIVLTR